MKLKTWIITVLMAVSTASLIQQVDAAQTPEEPHLVILGTGCVEAPHTRYGYTLNPGESSH